MEAVSSAVEWFNHVQQPIDRMMTFSLLMHDGMKLFVSK